MSKSYIAKFTVMGDISVSFAADEKSIQELRHLAHAYVREDGLNHIEDLDYELMEIYEPDTKAVVWRKYK